MDRKYIGILIVVLVVILGIGLVTTLNKFEGKTPVEIQSYVIFRKGNIITYLLMDNIYENLNSSSRSDSNEKIKSLVEIINNKIQNKMNNEGIIDENISNVIGTDEKISNWNVKVESYRKFYGNYNLNSKVDELIQLSLKENEGHPFVIVFAFKFNSSEDTKDGFENRGFVMNLMHADYNTIQEEKGYTREYDGKQIIYEIDFEGKTKDEIWGYQKIMFLNSTI